MLMGVCVGGGGGAYADKKFSCRGGSGLRFRMARTPPELTSLILWPSSKIIRKEGGRGGIPARLKCSVQKVVAIQSSDSLFFLFFSDTTFCA